MKDFQKWYNQIYNQLWRFCEEKFVSSLILAEIAKMIYYCQIRNPFVSH